MLNELPERTDKSAMRYEHAPQELKGMVRQVMPDGWQRITQGFQRNEGWMLRKICADLAGQSYGQDPKKDAVMFGLVDGDDGVSVIRPKRHLKLGDLEAA